jgi:hypothetical protein
MRPVATIAIGTLGLLVACAGELEDRQAFEAALRHDAGAHAAAGCDAPLLLRARCVDGCHTATAPAAGLDLASPEIAQRLSRAPASCGGLLIAPGDPSRSVLALKVGEAPVCGERMPRGAAPLSPGERSCIEQWIAGMQ